MILVQNSGSLVDVAVSALNKLTHPNAFRRGVQAGNYVPMVENNQPPIPNPHPLSWLLLSRISRSPFTCKIKVSPGTEVGATVDVETTQLTDDMGVGGASASAKDSRMAANPDQFQPGCFDGLLVSAGYRSPIGTGSNAKMLWNPFPNQTINLLPTGQTGYETMPAYMILAHELLHVDRMFRGKSLGDVVGFQSGGIRSASVPHSGYSSSVDIEHIEVIGLQSADWATLDNQVITENQIRAEHGFNARVKY